MRSRALGTFGLVLVVVRGGAGQAVAPPDVNIVARQLAEQVQSLGGDIAADLGQSPAGQYLIQDTQELAQAINQFRETLRDRPDPFQVRRAYAGIDVTWQHLRNRLSQPGTSTPAVIRDAQLVNAIDGQLHQALGLNAFPASFNAAGPPTAGIADTQRLAHALVDRAEALAWSIRSGMAADPNGAALAADAAELARAADRFHDAIDANQPVAVAAQAFGPVDAIADRVERHLTSNPVPPQVQSAWQAFASVEVLIHQNLGLASPQPNVAISLAPPSGGGPSPVLELADQLVAETAAFVQVFGPTVRVVPEGPYMLADAQRLQAAAADFRQDAARGLAPNQLAYEFRDVDAFWQRLARRVNRIARGRMGPNIAQVQKLGVICEQIHRALGMPGYPPVLDGPSFRP